VEQLKLGLVGIVQSTGEVTDANMIGQHPRDQRMIRGYETGAARQQDFLLLAKVLAPVRLPVGDERLVSSRGTRLDCTLSGAGPPPAPGDCRARAAPGPDDVSRQNHTRQGRQLAPQFACPGAAPLQPAVHAELFVQLNRSPFWRPRAKPPSVLRGDRKERPSMGRMSFTQELKGLPKARQVREPGGPGVGARMQTRFATRLGGRCLDSASRKPQNPRVVAQPSRSRARVRNAITLVPSPRRNTCAASGTSCGASPRGR
jgi:hypothetical protein